NLANGAPSHFAGGRGTRKKETFHPSPSEPLGGHWTLDDPNFLGATPQDDRTMHYALILPTRQILVVNGGNFDFYGPVHYPWLLTPKLDKSKKFTGYDKLRVAEAVEPRLYHNAALLMPDGRVWISGGNTARATVHSGPVPPREDGQPRTGQPKPDLSLVDLDMYFFNDGPMAKGTKGMLTTPTEDWVAEIYSPPYLFIDEGRQAHITAVQPAAAPGYDFSKEIGGKTYYLLHSNRKYKVALAGLPASCGGRAPALELIKLPTATHGWENGQQFVGLTIDSGGTSKEITFTTPDAKAANVPPAYYMMFYVDCRGKPSVARMVRFDDMAREP
ncbi:MAG TPA: galactose oxidase-like domain-containing protein, partial [Thermoanaerobaculia bacterium]|nr:galactose oxidase-like domain-containing protein [Thermoanaerobaculia bacterium]